MDRRKAREVFCEVEGLVVVVAAAAAAARQ
jgi:hypothetical protein